MAKWADFGVSAVRYDGTHTHIVQARVHVDNGEKIEAPVDRSRSSIVASIKKGTTFVSMTETEDGKWKKGQPINVVTINGTDYIKTESNEQECDNLENLPEF